MDNTDYVLPPWREMVSNRVVDTTPNRFNDTDYCFPPLWGEYSQEERDAWFVEQRVRDQMERQYEAGLWNQWDNERLEDGISVRGAMNKIENNEYQLK